MAAITSRCWCLSASAPDWPPCWPFGTAAPSSSADGAHCAGPGEPTPPQFKHLRCPRFVIDQPPGAADDAAEEDDNFRLSESVHFQIAGGRRTSTCTSTTPRCTPPTTCSAELAVVQVLRERVGIQRPVRRPEPPRRVHGPVTRRRLPGRTPAAPAPIRCARSAPGFSPGHPMTVSQGTARAGPAHPAFAVQRLPRAMPAACNACGLQGGRERPGRRESSWPGVFPHRPGRIPCSYVPAH